MSSILYKGQAGWTGSVDLRSSHTVTLTRDGPEVDLAFTTGQVIVKPALSTSAYRNTYYVTVTVKDGSGHQGSAEHQINFPPDEASGYYPDLGIPVPRDFDVNNLTEFSIVSSGDYSNQIYARQNGNGAEAPYLLPTVPGPPTGVEVHPSSVAGGTATLSWQAAEPGLNNPVASYEVWTWDINNGGPISFYDNVTTLSCSVEAAQGNGSTIAYAVKADGTVSGVDSIFSNAAVLKTEWSSPSAPTGLSLSRNDVLPGTSVTLSWAAAAGGLNNPVSSYDVYRVANGSTYEEKLGSTSGTAYTVTSVEGNGSYVDFRVRAIGTVRDTASGMSSTVRLRTTWSAPGTPGTPTLSANNVPPESAVTLTWAASAPGVNNPASYYKVFRSIDGGPFEYLTQTAVSSVAVTAPNRNGYPYAYKVQAIGTVSGSDSGMSTSSAGLYAVFTAPTVPTSLMVNGEADLHVEAGGELTIAWTASQPGTNNPVLSYDVFCDGRLVTSVAGTTAAAAASYAYGDTTVYTVRAHGQYSDSQASNEARVTINVPPAPPRSLKAISEFLFFNKEDELQFVRGDAVSVTVTEEEYRCNAIFPYNPAKTILHGMRIGWLEGDELLLFEIRQPSTDAVAMTQTIEAEHVAISELLDAAIEDRRPTDATAADAVEIALEGTGWLLGRNTFVGDILSTGFYMEGVWSALLQVRDKWGCTISPRLMYTDAGILRFIDVLDRRGENRGVRLTLDLNAQAAGITYDDRGLYTALYGQGSSPGDGQHLITFEDVYWSVDNGDPTNKPRGQKWVEDEQATAVFGRGGRKRFGFFQTDTLDPSELLRLTWDALQIAKKPKVTINMTAFNLAAIGYAWQGLAWGDDVVVVLDEIGVEVQARVTQFERDVLCPENSKPVIGDYRPDLVFEFAKR